MKITDFLKKFTLIDSKFIDDFYSFYDEGKNKYDKTINLNNICKCNVWYLTKMNKYINIYTYSFIYLFINNYFIKINL